MVFTPYSITLLFISLFMVIVYSYLWPRRAVRGVRPLSWLFLFAAVWCIGSSFKHAAGESYARQLWTLVNFAGIMPTPLLYLLFVVEYCGYERHFQIRFLRFLWIIPLLTFIAAVTNDYHNLLWAPAPHQAGTVLFWYGPLFWFYVAFAFFSTAIAAVILLGTLISTKGLLRWQLSIFLLATIIPALSVVINFALRPPGTGIDLSPVAFAVSALLVAYDVAHFNFLDILPVAHHSIFKKMRGGVMILDRLNRIVDSNDSLSGFLGRKIMAGTSISELGDIGNEITAAIRHSVPYETEIYDERQNRFYELRMTPLKDGMGRIVNLYDTTERKRSELKLVEANAALIARLEEIQRLHSQLKEQAIKDSLTGLYNRRFLDDILQKEISRSLRRESHFALIMMDVDNFKELNDNYGHDVGDKTLQQICEIIAANIRNSDYACRYGGDEIIVLLTNVLPENVAEKGEIFRRSIEEEFAARHEGKVTLSVGISVFPDDGADALHIFKHADMALYQAKRQGRNRVVRYAGEK